MGHWHQRFEKKLTITNTTKHHKRRKNTKINENTIEYNCSHAVFRREFEYNNKYCCKYRTNSKT